MVAGAAFFELREESGAALSAARSSVGGNCRRQSVAADRREPPLVLRPLSWLPSLFSSDRSIIIFHA
jgi:hypothetical protein